MRVTVLQHETHEDLGLLEPALKAAGFSIRTRFRGADFRDDVEAEALVVLGGSMGVGDVDEHPFLHDELAVLRERLRLERPCIGICLGAQLLAAAAGADVFRGKNGFEVGVAPIRLTKEGQADPVLHGLPAKPLAAHWHHDTWKAVPGATLLASTDRYVQQAFRLGPSYAFQFHPELTGEALSRWVDLGAASLSAAGADAAAIKAGVGRLGGAQAGWTEMLERLVHHLVQTATVR